MEKRHVPALRYFGMILAALLSFQNAAAEEIRWFPLKTGNFWEYDLEMQIKTVPAGKPPREFKIGGTHLTRVTGSDASKDSVFRVLHRIHKYAPEASIDINARFVEQLSSNTEGTRVHGHINLDVTGEEKEVPYDPPLIRLHQTLTPGTEWSIQIPLGKEGHSALFYEQEFKVVSIEDVLTPARLFRNCVKIESTSRNIGKFQQENGSTTAVQGDEVKTIEWYAPQIGLVKQIKRQRGSTVGEDGTSLTSMETQTLLLRNYKIY